MSLSLSYTVKHTPTWKIFSDLMDVEEIFEDYTDEKFDKHSSMINFRKIKGDLAWLMPRPNFTVIANCANDSWLNSGSGINKVISGNLFLWENMYKPKLKAYVETLKHFNVDKDLVPLLYVVTTRHYTLKDINVQSLDPFTIPDAYIIHFRGYSSTNQKNEEIENGIYRCYLVLFASILAQIPRGTRIVIPKINTQAWRKKGLDANKIYYECIFCFVQTENYKIYDIEYLKEQPYSNFRQNSSSFQDFLFNSGFGSFYTENIGYFFRRARIVEAYYHYIQNKDQYDILQNTGFHPTEGAFYVKYEGDYKTIPIYSMSFFEQSQNGCLLYSLLHILLMKNRQTVASSNLIKSHLENISLNNEMKDNIQKQYYPHIHKWDKGYKSGGFISVKLVDNEEAMTEFYKIIYDTLNIKASEDEDEYIYENPLHPQKNHYIAYAYNTKLKFLICSNSLYSDEHLLKDPLDKLFIRLKYLLEKKLNKN
jgi:hypothetical protein